MLPKCQIEIVINNISKNKAKVIEKALEPDNVDFPQGLSLEIKEKENQRRKMEKVLTKIPAHANKMQRRIDKQRASFEKGGAKITKEIVSQRKRMKKLAKNAAVLARKRIQEKLRKEKQLASHKKKVDKVIKETVKIANKKYKKSIRIVSDDAIKTGNRMTIVVKKSRVQ